jgi:hypothetical protein
LTTFASNGILYSSAEEGNCTCIALPRTSRAIMRAQLTLSSAFKDNGTSDFGFLSDFSFRDSDLSLSLPESTVNDTYGKLRKVDFAQHEAKCLNLAMCSCRPLKSAWSSGQRNWHRLQTANDSYCHLRKVETLSAPAGSHLVTKSRHFAAVSGRTHVCSELPNPEGSLLTLTDRYRVLSPRVSHGHPR